RSKRDWSSDVCSSDLERGQNTGEREPPCLPEERRDRECERCAVGVPYAVVVASDHTKAIRARGQPTVEGGALGTGLHPSFVDPRSEERRVGKEARARL